MDNLYTEAMLNELEREALLKIAADNQIEIPNRAPITKIRELILSKGVPAPDADPPADPAKDNSPATAPEVEVEDDDSLPKFSKGQLLKSNWYSHRQDLLSALLEDGKMYTHAAVDGLIKEFLERKVK